MNIHPYHDMSSSFQCCKKLPKNLYLLILTTMTNLQYLKLISLITYIPSLDVGTSSGVNMSGDSGLSSAVDKIPDVGKESWNIIMAQLML